ncbi:hypothetical protein EHV15_35375 [Paenibacillus oralis]|uniref:Uncharacterized protein n=1 Tax=Paenibacillus oralis TaxID=2490856 RepID=A0A3P3TA17_9BACL|nr:hypothetical protein [Paenibacillus oralis]RRJ54857.1 hypothetical protein EHV15_35375 [Paenibacillus oralis]
MELGKFKKVVEEYSKFYVVIGDDEIIHNVLDKCSINDDELSALAKYLANEFERTSNEGDMELNEIIEQLQYGVNFIFEAKEKGFQVYFKSKYIEQIM